MYKIWNRVHIPFSSIFLWIVETRLDSFDSWNKNIKLSVSSIKTLKVYYRPQRSCGKVMFLHLSVILFTGQREISVREAPQTETPGQRPP